MRRGPSVAHLPLWAVIATGLLALVGIRVLSSYLVVESVELLSVRSPDGRGDAVLLDIPKDARGTHSAAVCLRPVYRGLNRPGPCTSVAYLSGVPDIAGHPGISLQWRSATELEIHYRSVAQAYLYLPTFIWVRSSRTSMYANSRNFGSVHTTLVHDN